MLKFLFKFVNCSRSNAREQKRMVLVNTLAVDSCVYFVDDFRCLFKKCMHQNIQSRNYFCLKELFPYQQRIVICRLMR